MLDDNVNLEGMRTVSTVIDAVEGDKPAARGGVKSSLRTLEILETLSRSNEKKSVATLSRELTIPKSSLHGLLRTMESRGWLETDTTGTMFGLGLRALVLGNAYVESDDIVGMAQPVLDTLAELTGETVHLGRLDGADIVYLAKRESRHALRLFSAVGRRLPAHATALGKAILAQLPADQVDARLQYPLMRLTESTIVDRDALHDELARIRVAGWSTDDGENSPGIRCVGVALTSRAGSLNALSCSVPSSRMTDQFEQEIIGHLRDSARMLDSLIARLRT
jgi:DNA-binding IclR family transcriptional regulator